LYRRYSFEKAPEGPLNLRERVLAAREAAEAPYSEVDLRPRQLVPNPKPALHPTAKTSRHVVKQPALSEERKTNLTPYQHGSPSVAPFVAKPNTYQRWTGSDYIAVGNPELGTYRDYSSFPYTWTNATDRRTMN